MQSERAKTLLERAKSLRQVTIIQANDAESAKSPYMAGLLNGLKLAESIMRGTEYQPINCPKDEEKSRFETNLLKAQADIRELKAQNKELVSENKELKKKVKK